MLAEIFHARARERADEVGGRPCSFRNDALRAPAARRHEAVEEHANRPVRAWRADVDVGLHHVFAVGHDQALPFGSPQSKDGDDRLEEKVDLILKSVAEDGDEQIARLDHVYHRD